MMTELGRDAKILDLWLMTTLLETSPKEVREPMLLRLNEIKEDLISRQIH